MNAETFCEHFATFADAPNGIAKLRELILWLAVKGQLVAQDANDESVAELLASIAVKRESGDTGASRRTSSNQPTASPHLPPHQIPVSWAWTRFDEVATIASNLVQPGAFPDSPHVAPDNIEKGTGRLLPCQTVKEDDVRSSNHQFFAGQILYSKIRPNLAKVVIVDFAGLCSADMYPINAHIDAGYLLKFMLSKTFLGMAVRNDTRVAMPKINQEELNAILVAVPPLAEQRRIVEKVDQLLGLCDELAARQAAQREKRQRLVGATLDRLVSTRNPAESPTHAHRLRNHFDHLFDTPTTIPQLRQAILQLAVQGQLVPQDPNDKPANVALADIEKERTRRVEAGEIPSQRPVSEMTVGDELFELPLGWQWARFGHLCLFIEAGWSPKCEERPRIGDEWGVIKISAVTWGQFNADENKTLPSHMEPRLSCEIHSGDFLMSRANTAELVARSVVVNDVPPRLLLNDKVLRVRFPDSVDKHYVNLFNNGGFARQYYVTVASGTSESMRNVSRESILEMPIPVPPLAEQKRIVTKVTELLSLCDALEAKLTQAESASTQLLSAAVHRLLSPTMEG